MEITALVAGFDIENLNLTDDDGDYSCFPSSICVLHIDIRLFK